MEWDEFAEDTAYYCVASVRRYRRREHLPPDPTVEWLFHRLDAELADLEAEGAITHDGASYRRASG